ncbi:hypothetical protein J7I98_19785 [Streptomyces sp. ISL-98]|uniref:hypothetical protein n=1 Tax=Streptomyces sp. ISL-98 TaxID=2819192 RepID=UPI001BE68769|nr:hypothetical protein [Streptomyces sp. ISL-98]MBT2508086.1 hypothetical protein [Streptomyces sp. ISL-98]
MSDTESTPAAQEGEAGAVQDLSDAIRAEIQREYAGKLARTEIKAQAAKAGINLPEDFAGYLDTSK